MHVWRWTASQLKPMAGKEAEAEAEAKKKTVWTAEQELDADQGKLPAIAWTTFKSWQEVGAWYAGLEADRVTPGPEVKAKVAVLAAMLAAAFQSKACRRWSGAGCAPSRGSPAQYGNDRAPYVAVRRRFQPI